MLSATFENVKYSRVLNTQHGGCRITSCNALLCLLDTNTSILMGQIKSHYRTEQQLIHCEGVVWLQAQYGQLLNLGKDRGANQMRSV